MTVWSKDIIETLKGLFLCTDWDIFYGLGIDKATDTITENIKFCMDCVATKNIITTYPINKRDITREVKSQREQWATHAKVPS